MLNDFIIFAGNLIYLWYRYQWQCILYEFIPLSSQLSQVCSNSLVEWRRKIGCLREEWKYLKLECFSSKLNSSNFVVWHHCASWDGLFLCYFGTSPLFFTSVVTVFQLVMKGENVCQCLLLLSHCVTWSSLFFVCDFSLNHMLSITEWNVLTFTLCSANWN